MFLLECLLWKVLLEDGAVVAQFQPTTAPYTTAPDTNPALRSDLGRSSSELRGGLMLPGDAAAVQ